MKVLSGVMDLLYVVSLQAQKIHNSPNSKPLFNYMFIQNLHPSSTLRTGAMGNQTTTMTMNTVQKCNFTLEDTGTIGIVSSTTTGSARYAKVNS